MYPSNAYRIWFADADDADALRQLEEQNAQPPLVGRVLMGEIDGTPAAALSLYDGRVIADRSRKTGHLVATLRRRASAIRAHEATPLLQHRLRATLTSYRRPSVVAAAIWRDSRDDDKRLAA
jgi:hypothetical protein